MRGLIKSPWKSFSRRVARNDLVRCAITAVNSDGSFDVRRIGVAEGTADIKHVPSVTKNDVYLVGDIASLGFAEGDPQKPFLFGFVNGGAKHVSVVVNPYDYPIGHWYWTCYAIYFFVQVRYPVPNPIEYENYCVGTRVNLDLWASSIPAIIEDAPGTSDIKKNYAFCLHATGQGSGWGRNVDFGKNKDLRSIYYMINKKSELNNPLLAKKAELLDSKIGLIWQAGYRPSGGYTDPTFNADITTFMDWVTEFLKDYRTTERM